VDDAGDNLIFAEEVFLIQGAIFAVYRDMGPGFLEGVYQECLALEFAYREIAFTALQPLTLRYRGRELRHRYVADFVCFERVILEIKAVRELAPGHRAQLINYLRATGLKLGLLVNFCAAPKVQIVRVAL
jgi:GxxExxY protein